MARYIDADKLLKDMECMVMHDTTCPMHISVTIEQIIEQAPTADVVEVKRGKWELYGDDDSLDMVYWCSCCRFHLSEDLFYKGYENGNWIENNVFKFCPNCGADMRGGCADV